MPTLTQKVGAAIKSAAMRFSGYRNYTSYGGHGLGNFGGPIDFIAAAGDPIDNSIVFATIDWIARTFPEAPIRVVKETPKGDEPQPAHPMTMKWRRPNPFDSGSLLWAPVILSYILDGNGYLLKERTNGGDVLNLWYVPHWTMEPRWPSNGREHISHYDYRVDGQVIRYEIADVVHLRKGKDPRNTRKGLSPMKAILREIGTDNLALQYSMAMLGNYGTPGAIISPGSPDQVLTEDQGRYIKQDWIEKTTGNRRGEPMVSLGSVKVDIPTFSPQQMNVRESSLTPEERISSVLGIPAVVVGLGAGLIRSTFANYEQSREAAYQSFLIPTQSSLAEQLTIQLLPDFSTDPVERVAFDYTKVRALNEDENELATRAGDLFAKGIIDRASALTMIGQEPTDSDKGIYFLARGGSFGHGLPAEPVAGQTVPVDTEPGLNGTPPPVTNGRSATPVPKKPVAV